MDSAAAVANGLVKEALVCEAKQELHEAIAKLEQVREGPGGERTHSPAGLGELWWRLSPPVPHRIRVFPSLCL